jgi:hypothetical protein
MKKILFSALLVVLYSCAEDDCIKRIDMVGIGERTIPDTIFNLDHAQLILKAEAINGCWSNLYLELNENNDFEYTLKAYGTYESCGACPSVMVYQDTIIDFHPTQTGTYLFKISELPNQIVVDTIIVK